MLLNFTNFASKYKMVNKKLTCYPDNIIHRVFPVILDCHLTKWSIAVSNQTNWVAVLGGRVQNVQNTSTKIQKYEYNMVNKKLTCYPDNIIHRVFPVILDCHFAKWSIAVSNQTNWVVVLGGLLHLTTRCCETSTKPSVICQPQLKSSTPMEYTIFLEKECGTSL